MEMLLALGEIDGPLHVWFKRPGEADLHGHPGTVFVTFFSPRQACPDRLAENHYRFSIQGGSVYASILGILELLEEELDGRDVTVHFGWPTSSWLDRMATGVFVAALMRLPRALPAHAVRDGVRAARRPSTLRRLPPPAHERSEVNP